MVFSDQLYQKVKPIWEKNHAHPFVQGIGNGTLEVEKFRFYMIQDYLYLIEYAKLFALAAVKATDLQTMGEFSKLLHATMYTEMDLHRQYAGKFGISTDELENAQPAAVTLAYSHYMLHVAQNGSLAELISAVLPCMWSYSEIGQELSQIPGAQEHEFYGEWVKMYASPEIAELSDWLIQLLNELAQGKTQAELKRLEEIFLNTSRFEYMFWEMSYSTEMWPTDE
jgi:thiaminase/transcriptional activator TenA